MIIYRLLWWQYIALRCIIKTVIRPFNWNGNLLEMFSSAGPLVIKLLQWLSQCPDKAYLPERTLNSIKEFCSNAPAPPIHETKSYHQQHAKLASLEINYIELLGVG